MEQITLLQKLLYCGEWQRGHVEVQLNKPVVKKKRKMVRISKRVCRLSKKSTLHVRFADFIQIVVELFHEVHIRAKIAT